MNRRFTHIVGGLMLLVLISACRQSGHQFSVRGELIDTLNSMLYLYEVVGEPQLVDSVKIEKGRFTLHHTASGDAKLYQLSTSVGSLYFSADSSTQLQITSSKAEGAMPFEFVNADEENRAIYAIQQEVCAFEMTTRQTQDIAALDSLVSNLRQHLLQDFIYAEPRSMAAIVALLQAPFNIPLFFPESGNRDDIQAYGAVATAFETFRPNSVYTPMLKEKALLGMAIKSKAQTQQARERELLSQATEVAFPPIHLYDSKGVERSLADVAAQHPKVILGFIALGAEDAPSVVSRLRSIYEREKGEGLEIFLVSLDQDKSLWLQSVRTLPWINTWDPEGRSASSYGVQRLPLFFMIQGDEVRELTL